MQLVTSALAVGVLLVFCARELSRVCGCRVRCLSDRHTKVIMSVITQEADEAHAPLVGATAPLSSHRSDVYLPPLPTVLLSTIGLGPADLRAAVAPAHCGGQQQPAARGAAGPSTSDDSVQPLRALAPLPARASSRPSVAPAWGHAGEPPHGADVQFVKAPTAAPRGGLGAPLLGEAHNPFSDHV